MTARFWWPELLNVLLLGTWPVETDPQTSWREEWGAGPQEVAAPDHRSLIPGMSLSREAERPGQAGGRGHCRRVTRLVRKGWLRAWWSLEALSEGREKTASSLEYLCFIFWPSKFSCLTAASRVSSQHFCLVERAGRPLPLPTPSSSPSDPGGPSTSSRSPKGQEAGL